MTACGNIAAESMPKTLYFTYLYDLKQQLKTYCGKPDNNILAVVIGHDSECVTTVSTYSQQFLNSVTLPATSVANLST